MVEMVYVFDNNLLSDTSNEQTKFQLTSYTQRSIEYFIEKATFEAQ